MQHSKGWDGFGKGPFKYYSDFNSFMAAFEDEEDRAAYPEMFALPPGVYEVETPRPLGIAFEEVVAGLPRGIVVDSLVDGGNAAAAGVIRPGDILLATTACKEIGPRYVGAMHGVANTAGSLAGVVGTYGAGVVLEATGSWNAVLRVTAGVYLAGAAVWLAFSTGERVFD